MSSSEATRLLHSLSSSLNEQVARKSLAAALDFDRYFAIARSFDLNHSFWDGLLTARNERAGIALVVETRMGLVSASLARQFDRVISWHATEAAAKLSRLWFDANRISNVSVVVSPTHSGFDLTADQLAAIVMVGPDADPTGQWGEDGRQTAKSVLDLARTHLQSDGQIVVIDNNRWSYKRAGSRFHGGGLALLSLRHKLERMSLSAAVYVCAAPLTASHSPPPDMFRQDVQSKGSNLPKNWLARVKTGLLNRPAARLFWPSFLLVASRQPDTSLLERLLVSSKIRSALSWNRSESIEIKRVVAGNSGTSIVIAGPATSESADVVIRVPSSEKGESLCRINAAALVAMAGKPWANLVPRLVDEGVLCGRRYFVETRCPGFEVYSGTQGLEQMVNAACRRMSVLHSDTARRTAVTPELFEQRVVPFFDDIAAYCAADAANRLEQLRQSLAIRMTGCMVSLGDTHGDFKLGNILFSQSGEFVALIDWDGYSREGFQLFDYLTLLTYKMAYDYDCSMAKVFVAYILPWKLPEDYGRLVDDAVKGLLVDESSFLCIRIVFWFALLEARFDDVYKHHRRWHAEYLEPVLSAMESILAMPQTPKIC